MITFDDCPKRLDVCARRGVVRLVPRTPVDNAARVSLLREVADRIERGGHEVSAVAVAVSYADGDTGSGWSGDAVIPLLGALEVLRAKLGRRVE